MMTEAVMTSRDRVLKMLSGEKVSPVPCWSGVGNVTTAGLDKLGYDFATVHHDAEMMAKAAMSTYEIYGFEVVTFPFDLCLEAEILGCEMNPYADTKELLYPTIKVKSKNTVEDLRAMAKDPSTATKGRLPQLKEVVKIIREKHGNDVAIASYVLGPFTLGGQIDELEPLLKNSFKKPEETAEYLDALADIIIVIGNELRNMGIDIITTREMGATTDVLSPRVFKKIIMPPLKKIAQSQTGPSVLHICGAVLPIIDMMVEAGFDALSIDSKTPMNEVRERVGDEVVICGNFNPFLALNNGEASDAYNMVAECIKSGVNSVHPGCDIWPSAKSENMEAMIRACREIRP
tara:strand:+ start:31783 stop:32823 length:1041 start_codon:yes stop_codon:yes gene_type:complete